MSSKLTPALLAFGALFAFSSSTLASGVTVTTGAGYVPVVKKLVGVCKNTHGVAAAESYGGNVGQMLAQIASGSGVNVVISDKATVRRIKTPVRFSVEQPLGTTPLVLIWRKGVNIQAAEGLASPAVKSIAMPDARAAVYGRAGSQWVANLKNGSEAVQAKLMQVAGVPQVAGYVVRGEVDAGFVNVQAAKKNKKDIGGMMVVKSGYDPIELNAFVVNGHENSPDMKKFLECLQSAKPAEVLKNSGVNR